MDAMDELGPVLRKLQSEHDVLPFMEEMLPAGDVWFVPMPEAMVDLIAQSSDFTPPERGGPPVWLNLAGEQGAQMCLIVARPKADGELWVLAPARRNGGH